MRFSIIFAAVSTLAVIWCQTLQQETCDVDRFTVDVDVAGADALIGGLFEMRQPGEGGDGYGCGEPHVEVMLAYEAARWTIRRINDNNYIPGIKLGMRAYDTCYSAYGAIRAAQDFYPQFSTSQLYCSDTDKLNLGIMGAYTSWTTKPVAELTSQFPVSMISPAASTPDLSNKIKYPYFLRTGLGSADQIKSMIALMNRLNWKRIVLVYSDNDYGRDSANEFIRQSQGNDVCIVEMLMVPATGTLQEYADSVSDLDLYDVTGAIYFGDHYSIVSLMDALLTVDNTGDIQWMLSLVNMKAYYLPVRMRGAIFVQPEFTEVEEFFDYFVTSLDENNPPAANPWYSDWFMTTFRCKLPGVTYAPYGTLSECLTKSAAAKRLAINTNYAFLDTTIKAIYAYAKALKQAHQARCGVPGRCASLNQMSVSEFHSILENVDFSFNEPGVNINSMQNLRVGFDANGDSLTSAHRYWNYEDRTDPGNFQFVNVGSYDKGSMSLTSPIYMYNDTRTGLLADVPPSLCPGEGCNNCIVPRRDIFFNFANGDVIIGGLFDIHRQGGEVLTCGTLKASSALAASAFKYAIGEAKSFFGILNNVELGSLIVDMCDDAETGRMLLNDALGGRRIVRDMFGRAVDPNQIKAVVGNLDSGEALSMAEMLGKFMMPQMESSATSTALSNDMMFPYFSRVIPSDMEQVKAMVLMMKRLGWTYIQVVHTDGAYGRGGYELVRNVAARNGICVAAAHELRDDNYAEVVANLKNKPFAKAVFGIADGRDFRSLLGEIQNQGLQGQFLLIGSEAWGTKDSVVDGLETVAEGSLTIRILSPSMNSFRNWIDSLDPASDYVRNEMPFFLEWYQYVYQCYLDASNRGIYNTQCSPNQPISRADMYEEDAYAQFIISATYAAARAIHKALEEYCGVGYVGVCWQFRSAEGAKDIILKNLRDVAFRVEGTDVVVEDGEGKADYAIYSYTGGAYRRVGTYVTDGALDLTVADINLPANFDSRCQAQCGECVYLLQDQPYRFYPEDKQALIIGANFAAHNPSNGGDSFECTSLRQVNGIQSYLALAYALETVKMGTAPVMLNNGLYVSTIMLDHCNSPLRANGLPAALYSGLLDKPGMFEAGSDLTKIRAWMAGNNLGVEQMKDLFQDLNLPVISPKAKSNMFLDEDNYPTFLRSIQGESTVATALAVLAKSLQFQFVTVVYSDTSYGMGGMESFRDIAQQEGLCIIQTYEMNDDTSASDVVSSLIAQSTHVVVTYLSMKHMVEFIGARGDNTRGSELVILSPEPWPALYASSGSAANNVLSLRIKTPPLEGYLDFLRSFKYEDLSGHTLVQEYYEDLFSCNMPGNYRYNMPCSNPVQMIPDHPAFYQDNYVLPTINAVYTFVAGAHETLKIKCGEDYQSVCVDFYSDADTNTILLQKMKEVSFDDLSGETFDYVGSEGNTPLEIQLFDGTQMVTVADFAGASLNFYDQRFQDNYVNTVSSCVAPCTTCIVPSLNFTYIPGEILLGGLFDVHKSALRPFSCGDINTRHGFQLLEAYMYAIEQVNDKSGPFKDILKDVTLGGIGLDSCESAVRSGYLVSNINNRVTTLEKNGFIIDPDDIDVYIGSYSSDVSIYLARLMKSLKIPQISYGSSSVELLDQDKYPYFLRTVPADDRQAMAMIKLLTKFNIRYVQIVHTATNYGEQGAAIFKRLAAENQVCVAQMVSFPDISTITAESANDVVLGLLEKPTANTIIVFLDTEFTHQLLEAVQRNPEARGKFKFIGSDTWATDVEAIRGVEEMATGSITFDLQHSDLKGFDDYLKVKTPSNYHQNPWFSEYYEEIHNCYLTIPTRRYPGRCPSVPLKIITSRNYMQDTAIIHVINAVFAAAHGIHGALKEVCGDDYTTVCEAFKNLEGKRDLILEHTKEAKFMDQSGKEFEFSDRGDGDRGYVMYSIMKPSNLLGYVYSPIATYSTEGELTITDTDYMPSWDGSCNRPEACTECPTVRNPQQRYMLQTNPAGSQDDPATLVLLVPIHRTGTDLYQCGDLNLNTFMQAMMFFYTIEQLLPDRVFDLRGLVIDTCGNPLRIDQDVFNLMSSGKLCNSRFDVKDRIDSSTIVGFQTSGSRYTVAANRVLAPLKVTLTSYYATSTALSDTTRYPYFARTVPPDDLQMKVVSNLLRANDWKYVSVIYTTESYGLSAFRALRNYINTNKHSCIAVSVPISQHATPDEARAAVREVSEKNGAGVVILIVVEPRLVLEAAVAEGVASQLQWVGTDSWATSKSPVEGIQEHFLGAVTINFRDAYINNFITWMSQIRMDNRKDIPDDWFEEFYQRIHRCKLMSAAKVLTQYTATCSDMEGITEDKLKALGGISIPNAAAAYAAGKALYDAYSRLGCATGSETASLTISQCMSQVENFREKFFEIVLEQTWKIEQELSLDPIGQFHLELGEDRYWDTGYTMTVVTGETPEVYKVVGTSSGDDMTFNRTAMLEARAGNGDVVADCPEGELCNCDYGDGEALPLVTPKPAYQRPLEPRNYLVYDEDATDNVAAYLWPVWAIVVAVLSCIGILIALLLIPFFLCTYPVLGGTTILGFMMILGTAGIYAINFAWFLPASEATCGARRFCLGVVYAVAFAALFVKAVDNWRFSTIEPNVTRYKGLTSPLSLVLMALGIVLIQAIIPIQWLILENPTASLYKDNMLRHDWMWCDPHDFHDIALVLSMIFVILLVLLTSVFAGLAWDSESNARESRWILMACIATAGCFLVWMIVSTNAGPPYRDPAIAIGNFVNATALLICLPIRKFILLVTLKPYSGEVLEEKEKSFPPPSQGGQELYSLAYTNPEFQPDVFQVVEKSDSDIGM